jgi:hypothetical protein
MKSLTKNDRSGRITSATSETRPTLDLTLRPLQYLIRTVISEYPVYLAYVRRSHEAGSGKVLSDDTEIMIEGYTRSASTFAVMAFQLAQPSPVRMARHLHSSAHLIAAARRGLPTILCVRDPEPTVLSGVAREAHVTMRNALWAYARFHEKIYDYRSAFLISEFEEITSDFGAVIGRLNKKFDTDFAIFDHSEANVEECFALIEHRSRQPSWRKALGDFQSGLISKEELERAISLQAHDADSDRDVGLAEQLVARPSQVRNQMKAALKDEYYSARMSKLRVRAERAYSRLVEGVELPGPNRRTSGTAARR